MNAENSGQQTLPRQSEIGMAAGHALQALELANEAGAPPLLTTGSTTGFDVAVNDWDDLFSAVKSRLRSTLEQAKALDEPGALIEAAARVRANVLDCLVALDQLQNTALHEFARGSQLELQLFDTWTELAQVRAEPATPRDRLSKAQHGALCDSLTSLASRCQFLARLDQALAALPVLAALPAQGGDAAESLAVLYIDIEGFKQINGEHGLETGDEVLKVIASRLARAVRVEDMVGRLGSNEFACLLQGPPSRERVSQFARTLFDAIAAPLLLGNIRLKVRASIGIAMGPADGRTTDALLKHADSAMVRARRCGIGHAFFDRCPCA